MLINQRSTINFFLIGLRVCQVMYQTELNLALAITLIFPVCPQPCSSHYTTLPLYLRLIDKYYNDIVTCISASCRKAIPYKKSKRCAADYTVP